MKKISLLISLLLIFSTTAFDASAQWTRLLGAAAKTMQAITLSDSQMAEYAKQSVAQMDAQNKVAGSSDSYTQRLNRLTKGLTSVDGIPLNFKVYLTSDVNAFACPDGSVRVYSGLMDIMTDDEVLGVIGHEIGHVAKHHSKNAFKQALLNSAARDALASTNGTLGVLSASVLGDLGESLMSAKFSRKQETEADDYGYNFLKKHGVNPYGMVMAFEKLDKMSDSSKSSYVKKMFSSHPDTKDRIKRMEDKAKKDGYTRPSASSGATSTKKTTTGGTSKAAQKKGAKKS